MNILERVIEYIIQEKREKKEPTRMIALYPDSDSIDQIIKYREEIKKINDFSYTKELDLKDIHATLRWWKIEDGGKNTKLISKNLEKLQIENPTSSKITSVSTLGNSLSLMLKSEGMQNIFSMVDDVIRSCGAPKSDYPSYLPHVALFYHESFREDYDLSKLKKPEFSIVFDRMEFVDNDDKLFLRKRFSSERE